MSATRLKHAGIVLLASLEALRLRYGTGTHERGATAMSDQSGGHPPPGFYPAEHGRQRYWDGKTWTNRYADDQPPPGTGAPAAAIASGARRPWLLPVLALLLGTLLGVGIGKGSSDTASTAASPATTVTATVTAPGATVTSGPTVTAPPVTVTAPPTTVTYTPPPPAPGTSVSDGVYVVGQDIQPGTYRVSAAVSSGCYWMIAKSGTNGADIIKNDLPSGGFPQVTLAVGQDFTSNRCGTWVKK